MNSFYFRSSLGATALDRQSALSHRPTPPPLPLSSTTFPSLEEKTNLLRPSEEQNLAARIIKVVLASLPKFN